MPTVDYRKKERKKRVYTICQIYHGCSEFTHIHSCINMCLNGREGTEEGF